MISLATSITVTLHLWWLWPYFAIGLALWLPLEWLAWRTIQPSDRGGFWSTLRRATRGRPLRIAVPIVAWPLAIWELIR